MPWPDERLTTYAPGSQVKSADLNAIQDLGISHDDRLDDIEALKHGNKTLNLPVMGSEHDGGAVYVASSAKFIIDGGSAPGSVLHLGIPLKVGDRIRSVAFALTSSGTVQVRLVKKTAGTAPATIAEDTDAATNPSLAGIDYTIASGEHLFIEIQADSASEGFDGIAVTFDRP